MTEVARAKRRFLLTAAVSSALIILTAVVAVAFKK